MMKSRSFFVWATSALLGSSGCFSFGYTECTKNEDCPIVDGQRLSCTQDFLCVQGTPLAKMCKDIYPTSPMPGAIPIGVIMRLSATSGGDQFPQKAVQLGADEVNSYVGTGQRPISLHFCDSSVSGFDAKKAFRHLVDDRKVVGIVGPSTSREVIAVAQVAGDTQVPMISPSATAASLATLPQKDYVYKIAPSDDLQGGALARIVAKQNPMGAPKIALIYVNDAYGQGLRGSFVAASAVAPTLSREFTEGTPMAATSAVLAMGSQFTDVVVIANPDAPAIVELLLTLPKAVRIHMTDGAKNDALLRLVAMYKSNATWQDHFARVSGSSPTYSRAKIFDDFESAFQGRFMTSSTSDAFAPFAYDAFYSLAIALGNAKGGEPTGALVAAGLKRITGASNVAPVGRTSYLSACQRMVQGGSVPLDGVSGPISFKDGSREKGLFEQWTIDVAGGKFISTPAPN